MIPDPRTVFEPLETTNLYSLPICSKPKCKAKAVWRMRVPRRSPPGKYNTSFFCRECVKVEKAMREVRPLL